jgi:hypothetical protein
MMQCFAHWDAGWVGPSAAQTLLEKNQNHLVTEEDIDVVCISDRYPVIRI